MKGEMENAPPDLDSQVRSAYDRVEPGRFVTSCKFVARGPYLIVRISSHAYQGEPLLPPPYQIFRFDPTTGDLSSPSKDEIAEFKILNYK